MCRHDTDPGLAVIEGSTLILVAVAGALVATLVPWRSLLGWRPRCGQPMPRELRPTAYRTYPCQRRALHNGQHFHGQAFTVDQIRW